jgi:multiple sugar transport system permease protein
LGFVNTFVPLIVPSWLAQGEAKIFLLRQLFRGLPSDLEAAAKIDGASPVQRFTMVILPNAKAGIGIVLLLEFVTNWNKFIDPLIYLKEEKLFTLNVGLNMFRDIYSAAVFGVENIHWFMAVATLIVLPILVIFLFLQRFFIEGIQLSGMKG